jgi:hypothetical protein
MRQFPQFLKTNPVFNGLSFSDIGALLAVLYLSMLTQMSSVLTMILSVVAILVSKCLTRNFDLIGFLLPRQKSLYLENIDRGES